MEDIRVPAAPSVRPWMWVILLNSLLIGFQENHNLGVTESPLALRGGLPARYARALGICGPEAAGYSLSCLVFLT